MTTFADILLAAVALLAPSDGARVPVLYPIQRDYLQQPRAERFAEMDSHSNRVDLVRTPTAGQPPVTLAWSGAAGQVCTLIVDHAEGGARQEFAVTNLETVRITNLDIARKYRWTVRAADGSEASATFTTEDTPPRLLRAGGVLNFRDAGGWKTTSGQRVREDMIFRSAGLRDNAHKEGSFLNTRYEPGENRVTPAGIATLRDEFRIRTDVELRNNEEAAAMTSSILGPDVRWAHIPFVAYGMINLPERGKDAFARIFRLFTDRKNYPILVHCSGGRDRTGTLVFLLNGLLGVSEDDLCRDWEATVFDEDDPKFDSERIRGLLKYLATLGSGTVRERVERYALSCGISEQEIKAFREIMLEANP